MQPPPQEEDMQGQGDRSARFTEVADISQNDSIHATSPIEAQHFVDISLVEVNQHPNVKLKFKQVQESTPNHRPWAQSMVAGCMGSDSRWLAFII